MRFAHMSDCHLGSWSSHPDMKDFPLLAFEGVIETCIKERVDFILIAGDLFDTALPSIDVLKRTAACLRKCREAGISIYAISGSHDYSPTGKTMLSVFEESGLLADVCKYTEEGGRICLKFTVDKKTGARITGLMGKKGGLDINFYKNLDKGIEKEDGFKIFMFHAGVMDYGGHPGMVAVSLADLPKGFNYYATGHIHQQYFDNVHMVAFPGELFPTSFDELEDYNGGFYIVEEKDGKLDVQKRNAKMLDIALMNFDADKKTPMRIEKDAIEKISSTDISGKVLLMKFSGILESGNPTDINFKFIADTALKKGAVVVKRSTSGLKSREYEDIKTSQFSSTEEIEKSLLELHKEQLKISGVGDIASFTLSMMSALNDEKQEDETNATFEDRIKSNVKKVVGL